MKTSHLVLPRSQHPTRPGMVQGQQALLLNRFVRQTFFQVLKGSPFGDGRALHEQHVFFFFVV